jgi:hypothetical protein
MDEGRADPAVLLWLFLVIALGALLLWDRWGRDLWYAASDASGDLARWLRTRPWAQAFSALRTGHVHGGPVPSLPLDAPVVRLPRDYVERAPVPGHWNAGSVGTGTDAPPFPDVEPLDRMARDAAVADALGRLMALGIVSEADRVRSMEALYGPRGRRWQAVRPLIEAAARDAAPPVVTPLAGRVVPPGVRFEAEAE